LYHGKAGSTKVLKAHERIIEYQEVLYGATKSTRGFLRRAGTLEICQGIADAHYTF
jgi:hypothetical protein